MEFQNRSKMKIIALVVFLVSRVSFSQVVQYESCRYADGQPTVLQFSSCEKSRVCSGPVLCKTEKGYEQYEVFCKSILNQCPSASDCFQEFMSGNDFYVEKSKLGKFDFEEPKFGNLPNGAAPYHPHPHTFDKPGTDPDTHLKKEDRKKTRKNSF